MGNHLSVRNRSGERGIASSHVADRMAVTIDQDPAPAPGLSLTPEVIDGAASEVLGWRP